MMAASSRFGEIEKGSGGSAGAFGMARWPARSCDRLGFQAPQATYQHGQGRVAVMGGYVYRGSAIPGLVEAHAHLDKTLLGLPWVPNQATGNRVIDRIEAERRVRAQRTVPEFETGSALVRQVVANGTLHLRTHVDIDTELNVTGKVAQFGRGVMGEVSAKILKQFVALNRLRGNHK